MIASILYWLMGWAKFIGVTILNYFIDFFQYLFDRFIDLIIVILSLFGVEPSTCVNCMPPVPAANTTYTVFATTLSWFFPMQYFICVVAFVVASLIVYITIAPLARWAKLLK